MCTFSATCLRSDSKTRKMKMCNACYMWLYKWSKAKPAKLMRYIHSQDLRNERIGKTFSRRKMRRAS